MRSIILAILLTSLSLNCLGEEVFYKGQKRSLVKWENINAMKWTDFAHWKRDVYLKEHIPNYYRYLQDISLKEEVGRVLDCVGACYVESGDGSSRALHRSSVEEGEDVTTRDGSYMWVFLIDGTMVRLSPNSSVTFKEINIGKESNFIHARINYGNVLWMSRSESKLVSDSRRETDQLFLPLSFYDANQDSFRPKLKEEDLFEYFDKGTGTTAQFERLNKLIEKNDQFTLGKRTKTLLVTPSGTLTGENPTVEFIVLVGEKSYFKQRSLATQNIDSQESTPLLEFGYRGFENKDMKTVEYDTWYQVSETGRYFTSMPLKSYRRFSMGEFVTKRIPTILVARELWLAKYSKFAFQDISKKNLAKHFGYRLWREFKDSGSSEIDLRIRYLNEYTRRLETTNLLASVKLKSQFAAAKDEISGGRYTSGFYERAINAFYRRGDMKTGDEMEAGELNSTRKKLWKRLNAIK